MSSSSSFAETAIAEFSLDKLGEPLGFRSSDILLADIENVNGRPFCNSSELKLHIHILDIFDYLLRTPGLVPRACMGNSRIDKRPNDMNKGIHLPDFCQELIPQPLTLMGPFD